MSDEEEAFQRTDDGYIKAPTLIPTDYLEIAVLAVVLSIGVPLNAVVLRKLLRQYSAGKSLSRAKQDDTRMGFLMLKIHMTIIDLIFIVLYCPSKLVWLISYVWPFGQFVCKAVQYSWMFAHHSMSFAVVSIAIDRVKTVHDLMALRGRGRMVSPKSKINCIKRMIVLTYLGAAVFSLPQWLAWTTADLGSWSQCTTIWHQQRAIDFLNGNEYTYFFYWEQIYTIVHLTTMFWGPFAVLILSYACITFSLFLYSFASPQEGTELHAVKSETGSLTTLPSTCGSRSKVDTVDSPCETSPIHPAVVRSWRVEMRARMCHTSAVVIMAYLLCWLPYNLISLAMFFSKELSVSLSIHFDIVRVFVIFNTFLNPFIYGFHDT